MSKTTSAAEYHKMLEDKRRARKIVDLPSGAKFMLKKIDVLSCAKIFKHKRSLLDEVAKTSDEDKLVELLCAPEVSTLFIASVESPRLSENPESKDELDVRDIEPLDRIALFNEIIVFNDLDKFTAERVGFFRKESSGPRGRSAGGKISSIA